MEKTNILKRVLVAIVLLLVAIPSWCADGDTFTANTAEGVSMTFKVISESEKTCQVGNGNSTPAIATSYAGVITIPSSANEYKVTSIWYRAFWGCSGLTSITIPSSVTSIGTEAFRDCSGLTSIKVENGNTKYDSRENCNAIIETSSNTLIAGCRNTIIPSSVTSIGGSAFEGCSGLTSITIPEGVTSIGSSAFYGCSGLTSITIPSSVTSIGDLAFYGCSGLTSITIPSNVTSIGDAAFYGCSGLTSVTIPEGVTSIGDRAFRYCSGLTSITIPSSVTSIGDNAFQGCTSLTSITIPSSVTSIGDRAFVGCSGLTSIKVENGNTKYDSRENCNAIIETSSYTLIAGCRNTIIPSSVTSIGDGAFQGCSGLTSITIPEGVTSIGGFAFYGCSGLTSVTVCNETPVSINEYKFSNHANATLYVPYGCKAAYEAADGWKDFKEIKEIVSVTDISQMDNVIYIEPVEARSGSELTLSVKMKNNVEMESFGFDMVLPEGITVATDVDGYAMAELSTERTSTRKTNVFGADFKEDGSLNVQAYSTNGSTISGYDGEIALITIKLASDLIAGDYPILLKNIAMADAGAVTYRVESVTCKLTVPAYKLGDANSDGYVDVGDLTAISHKILNRPDESFNPKAADANEDSSIDVGDLTAVSHIILWGSVQRPQNAPKKRQEPMIEPE